MDGWTDERTDGQWNGRIVGRTDSGKDEQWDGWTVEWTDSGTVGQWDGRTDGERTDKRASISNETADINERQCALRIWKTGGQAARRTPA